jgi:hypothetical protein
MTETIVDYGEDTKLGSSLDSLALIEELASRQVDAEAEVARVEAELKKANEKLKDIAERLLPEAMDAARQKDITTTTNIRVKVENKVRASISEAKRGPAFKWLRENDHGSMIKTALSVPFEPGRDPAALGLRLILLHISQSSKIADDLQDALLDYEPMEEAKENIKAAFSFLRAIGNEAEQRIELNSSVHAQSLAALIRELLKGGKIDQETMELLGAHAWKEATVKVK